MDYHAFEAIRLYTIKAPSRGVWKVRVAGRGLFYVMVNAKTDLRLTDVSFVGDGVPLEKQPKLGTQVRVAITGIDAKGFAFQRVHKQLFIAVR